MTLKTKTKSIKQLRLSSYLKSIVLAIISTTNIAYAQSTLFDGVKTNPKEAHSLCADFRKLNKQGISANSAEVIDKISIEKNLSKVEAEIFSMYVRGLHCSDVV